MLFFPNETDENFSKYFKKSDIKKINEIINNQNKFYEIKNKHAYTKIINESSYNLRKLILQTWKLLKPIEQLSDESDDEYKIDIGIRESYDSDDSDE